MPHTQVLELKGLGWPSSARFATPGRFDIAVGPTQSGRVPPARNHPSHTGDATLLSGTATAGVLARNAGRHNGQRFGTDVLAELEVFKIAQAGCLVVVPDVGLRYPGFQGAYGIFPTVHVVKPVTVGYAATRETNEAGVKVGDDLSQVGSKTIVTSLEGVDREKRHHIKMNGARFFQRHFKTSLGEGFTGFQRERLLLPGVREIFSDGLCHHIACFIEQAHGEFAFVAFGCPGKEGEPITLALFECDAVKASLTSPTPVEVASIGLMLLLV